MRVSDFNKIVQGNDMDLARNNLYSIEVYMPRGHGGEFGNFYTGGDEAGIKEKLSYMAKTVTLPSKALGTIPAKRFGPMYKVANELMLDTVSMTFMCSADYREHLFFDGWLSGIMGQIKNPQTRQVYSLSYYNDYVSQVNIIPLDRQGGAAAQVTLMEAYPTAVGAIEFAWGNAGEVATFSVTWTFKDWNHTQTSGWSADTDLMGYGDDMGNISPWDFESQKYRKSPGEISEIRKMGSGLDDLNAPITPIGKSKDGFREASKGGIYPSAFRAARVGLTGKSEKGFRQSPGEIRKAKFKMGSGLDGLNAPITPIGKSKDGFREAPGNTKSFSEAPSKWVNPDTRDNKWVNPDTRDNKWVNPDTRGNKYPGVIPSHKTRPAPGHDGSLVKGLNLVKGLKSLLNILIR